MKKIVITLGCMVIAPLAFAQPNSTEKKKQKATTTEPVKKPPEATIRTMIAEGAAANYQPNKTLVWAGGKSE